MTFFADLSQLLMDPSTLAEIPRNWSYSSMLHLKGIQRESSPFRVLYAPRMGEDPQTWDLPFSFPQKSFGKSAKISFSLIKRLLSNQIRCFLLKTGCFHQSRCGIGKVLASRLFSHHHHHLPLQPFLHPQIRNLDKSLPFFQRTRVSGYVLKDLSSVCSDIRRVSVRARKVLSEQFLL